MIVRFTVRAPSMYRLTGDSEQLSDFFGGEKSLAIDDLHFLPR